MYVWPALRDYILRHYFRKWVVLGSLIGAVAGVGSIAFFYSIREATLVFLVDLADYRQPLARGESATDVGEVGRQWVLPLVLMVGGLISGLIVIGLPGSVLRNAIMAVSPAATDSSGHTGLSMRLGDLALLDVTERVRASNDGRQSAH